MVCRLRRLQLLCYFYALVYVCVRVCVYVIYVCVRVCVDVAARVYYYYVIIFMRWACDEFSSRLGMRFIHPALRIQIYHVQHVDSRRWSR